jgi:hypothetical protein
MKYNTSRRKRGSTRRTARRNGHASLSRTTQNALYVQQGSLSLQDVWRNRMRPKRASAMHGSKFLARQMCQMRRRPEGAGVEQSLASSRKLSLRYARCVKVAAAQHCVGRTMARLSLPMIAPNPTRSKLLIHSTCWGRATQRDLWRWDLDRLPRPMLAMVEHRLGDIMRTYAGLLSRASAARTFASARLVAATQGLPVRPQVGG